MKKFNCYVMLTSLNNREIIICNFINELLMKMEFNIFQMEIFMKIIL